MIRVPIHTLPVRIWHWANACLILLLMLTGVQLRAPELALFGKYGNAVWLHKHAGFCAVGAFAFWILHVSLSGYFWRNYLPRRSDLGGIWRQVAYYGFGIFRGAEKPFEPSVSRKFDPLQKLVYLGIMTVVTPVAVFTGIIFSDILYFQICIEALGGLRVLDLLHVATAYVFVLYVLLHLYMATTGPSVFSYFKAMIVGFYDIEGVHPGERSQRLKER